MQTKEDKEIARLHRKIRRYQELEDDTLAYLYKIVRHRKLLFNALKDLEPLFDYPPGGYEEECKAAQDVLIAVEKYMKTMRKPKGINQQ